MDGRGQRRETAAGVGGMASPPHGAAVGSNSNSNRAWQNSASRRHGIYVSTHQACELERRGSFDPDTLVRNDNYGFSLKQVLQKDAPVCLEF
ncbi:hypothetical protein PR001_g30550 [Phytophthora rubi]|uniref:Uncharacterized protein n=2 Tax=Phytophthora rubi TaxID=129364 RepID=A0A6A3GSH9_9STRA|nr:hypothetical protein PR001_g30550 [Phytophthora rubi]KAE8964381.1 hypothetical protein PR002_g28993 [Phytophthora rubi]